MLLSILRYCSVIVSMHEYVHSVIFLQLIWLDLLFIDTMAFVLPCVYLWITTFDVCVHNIKEMVSYILSKCAAHQLTEQHIFGRPRPYA